MASGGQVLMAGMNMSVDAQAKLTGQGNSTGAKQARELVEFVQENGPPSFPAEPGVVTIVAGDLNMRPSHQEYVEMASVRGSALDI
jgi:endonuclease/exonuclease/phosphatase family metal-dependent hydrolase